MKKEERQKIVFVWDNFGPIHADRCDATAVYFKNRIEVIGIEVFGRSDIYDWVPEAGSHFKKITLLPKGVSSNTGTFTRAWRTIIGCFRAGGRHVFMCHYEHPSTLIAAFVLTMFGRRVFVMNDSKYDDYERHLWREVVKSLFYLPYKGGMASGVRSKDYLRFLGLPRDKIVGVYNCMSIERIRRMAGVPRAPAGVPFEDRHFSIVARLVPKKNIVTALKAYARYTTHTDKPRPLHIFGSGPLEAELRAQVSEEGLNEHVQFHGFVQTMDVAKALGSTLALLLTSTEEQFGNVVIEAQAMGVPVILSANCGATDTLILDGVNGFIVEPMNEEGFAFFMELIDRDAALWRSLSESADRLIDQGDALRFAQAVEYLIEKVP